MPVPSLLGAYLWIFTSSGGQRYGAWIVAVVWALGALPAMAYAARRTFAAAPAERRRMAGTLLAGRVLVALGQTLTAELMQVALRNAMPPGLLSRWLDSISIGFSQGQYLILPAAIITVGMAGPMLLGLALRDAAGTEAGG